MFKNTLAADKTMETNWDVDFPSDTTASFVRTNNDGEETTFKPLGVHIHTPAEHTVNGHFYDAEVHIVH
jgi:carbonic anhydrase